MARRIGTNVGKGMMDWTLPVRVPQLSQIMHKPVRTRGTLIVCHAVEKEVQEFRTSCERLL